MEAPIVGGNTGALPLQGQAARREWRKVSEMPNGQGRLGTDRPENRSRTQQSGRPRSGNMGQRRNSQNGRMFHPGSSEHSSDSDHHVADGSGGHLMGGPISSQEMINQNIVQQDALYDEMHRQRQNERAAMNTMSMESGLGVMNNPEDAFEQQLLEVSRKREQLQQAELELRAQFIARSEVHRMQNSYEEQSKQHADIVTSLQNEIHERDQRIHHLEQSLEEREQQHRSNQMQANEAVWAKDGLLQQQTNELASLRRERDAALSDQKVALSQLDAERSDYAAQIDHIKEQLHEKERQRQEAEEQHRASQDLLLFKDGQLQDAQAWMARAQELDAYHINANNTLHAELRDRSDQLNQVWMGYQRQLADIERFHAQVVQRLQTEVNEAREHSQMLKGPGTERLGAKEEGQFHAGNQIDVIQREASEETGVKATPTNNSGVVRGNPIIFSPGTMEATVPAYIPLDNSAKGEFPVMPGLPVVPLPAVVAVSPIMSSVGTAVMQQFSYPQQPSTAVSQASSVPHTSFPQVHMHPHVLSTPHHPSAQQQIGHAQLHQNPQQQQPIQVPHHSLSSPSLQKHSIQPSLPHQLVLDREESQQHGGILLSQLSSKVQDSVSSMQPSVQESQQEATVTEPVQPSREDRKSPLSSQDQQQGEHAIQHHRQSTAQPERQRQEQHQHPQSHKQVPVQHHDEAHQMQHQQGISSSMHHLSQPAAPVAEENQLQKKLSPIKSNLARQEPRHSVANIVNPQLTAAEPIKNPEPVLLDERALLACLVRAVPAEANAKISIKSTLPNRLGKMLAPLHWQSYRKQYGRLDEFVSSHKELFVIDGDYIYLREGAHANVSATTAAAKASAAAAAANPVGLDRLPTVAVTPVAQVSQLQRGRNMKASNRDSRSQPQQGEANIHTELSISLQLSKAGNARQNSVSVVPRNNAGDGISGPANGGKLDGINNNTGAELGSKKSSPGNNSGVTDNGDANGYESSRGVGYHGSRQQNSRNSNAGSGQYKRQDNLYRSQAQDGRLRPTPTQ